MVDTIFIKRRVIRWLIVFIFVTLIGLMNFSIIMTEKMASRHPIPFQYPFVHEMTGVYTILVLLPALLWFFKRYPMTRKNLLTHIPLYVLVSILFGTCHTGLMWLSRILVYWLANMGPFDYGRMDYRLLMEYHKQLIVFWFIFGTVFLIRYVQKNQEEKLRAARLEEALTKARLQALQMQLHPHFLFNTLNMISSIMYENVKAADKIIASLSDLLRITLKSTNREAYTLEKELELLNLYIEIMKARFRDNLVIHLDINSGTRHALVPGFILQPLVENSIRHSMDHLKTTEIQITSRKKNERLILMVKDNGPGITGDAQQIIEKGVGLSNIVERFEELYGTDYSFQMQNINGGGLQVVINIPFQQRGAEQSC